MLPDWLALTIYSQQAFTLASSSNFHSALWPALRSWFITIPVIRRHEEKNHFIIPLPCSLDISLSASSLIHKDEIGVGLFLSGACSTSSLLKSQAINLCQSPFCSTQVTWSPYAIAPLGTVSLSCLALSLTPSGHLLLHLTHPPPPHFLSALLPPSDLLCPPSCRSALAFPTWISLEFKIDSNDFWFFFSAPFPPSLYLSKLLKCSLLLYCRKSLPHPLHPSLTPIHPFSLTTKDFVAVFKENADRKLTHLLLQLTSSHYLLSWCWLDTRLSCCVSDRFGVYLKNTPNTVSDNSATNSAQICLECICSGNLEKREKYWSWNLRTVFCFFSNWRV